MMAHSSRCGCGVPCALQRLPAWWILQTLETGQLFKDTGSKWTAPRSRGTRWGGVMHPVGAMAADKGWPRATFHSASALPAQRTNNRGAGKNEFGI